MPPSGICWKDICQISLLAEIVFKEGDTEHRVEVEVLYDGVREMREAFTVHLKPDENMVAETTVRIKINENGIEPTVRGWP